MFRLSSPGWSCPHDPLQAKLTRVQEQDAESGRVGRGGAPVVLCAGIAVEDFIFRVDRFPTPGTKSVVEDFVVTGGGCAANAAITIARLEGRARFAGPLGDDETCDRILDGMRRAGVVVDAAVRVAGAVTSLSGIFVDAGGERLLATRRGQGLQAVRPHDPQFLVRDVDVILVDNHFPDFVLPICQAGARRGARIVLDVDRAIGQDDPLLALATHPIFSAEALRSTTGIADLEGALDRAGSFCGDFIAATDGANGAFWRHHASIRHVPAFAVEALDTLAAGDVFHGAFALALAEGRSEEQSLRFAAAAAALKCTRFGGIVGAPIRGEVERLLEKGDDSVPARTILR
jgi:sulfofructose kinase